MTTVNTSLQSAIRLLAQAGIPVLMAPSGFFANNGVYVLGQAPSSAATVSFSATSGAGVTMTFSAATLLGTAVDVGRVVTILDTTYKYATITAQSSTTVATVTLTGTLSGTGPFANASTWLSGPLAGQTNAVAFSALLALQPFPNLYMSVPANAIGAGVAAGVYFAQPLAGGPNPGTVFTFYNNALVSGVPTIPASPLAFATTGPGAFSQTTGSPITLISIPIPANSMGPNGRVRYNCNALNNLSANNHTYTQSFGGSNVEAVNNNTFNTDIIDKIIINSGVTNAQQANAGIGSGQTGLPTILNIDTTAAVNVNFIAQLANANDWMGYNYVFVELAPN